MKLRELNFKEKVKLREKTLQFMHLAKTNKKIGNPFFNSLKLKLVKNYNDIIILSNEFYKELFAYQKVGSLFTIEEEYEQEELEFFKQFYLDILKKRGNMPLSLQDFIKYMTILRELLFNHLQQRGDL